MTSSQLFFLCFRQFFTPAPSVYSDKRNKFNFCFADEIRLNLWNGCGCKAVVVICHPRLVSLTILLTMNFHSLYIHWHQAFHSIDAVAMSAVYFVARIIFMRIQNYTYFMVPIPIFKLSFILNRTIHSNVEIKTMFNVSTSHHIKLSTVKHQIEHTYTHTHTQFYRFTRKILRFGTKCWLLKEIFTKNNKTK